MTGVEQIGTRIKRLRADRKMTQDRLAIEARVDQSGLSKFERGMERSMSEELLRRIAGVLKIPFDELITGTNFEVK